MTLIANKFPSRIDGLAMDNITKNIIVIRKDKRYVL